MDMASKEWRRIYMPPPPCVPVTLGERLINGVSKFYTGEPLIDNPCPLRVPLLWRLAESRPDTNRP